MITPLTGPCDDGPGPALSSRRLRPGVPPPPVSDVSQRVSAAGASRGRGWRSTPTSVLNLVVTERRQTPLTLVNRELSPFGTSSLFQGGEVDTGREAICMKFTLEKVVQ